MIRVEGSLYDQVAGLLDSMGDDPGAVAATLRVEDIRGVRGSVVAHPVCWWLTRLVPELCVVLGPEAVHASLPGQGLARQGAVVPLPPPVRAFVQRFDDGQHPDLELSLGRWAAGSRNGDTGAGWEGAAASSPGAPGPVTDTVPIPAVPAGPPVVVDGEPADDQAGPGEPAAGDAPPAAGEASPSAEPAGGEPVKGGRDSGKSRAARGSRRGRPTAVAG